MIEMTKCNKDTVMKGYKKTSNLKILNEFIESGEDCVKLTGWKHKSPYACTGSLVKSIQRFKLAGITAVTVKGEVYLIKN